MNIMSLVPKSAHILRLYKDLLRYGQTLKLSEKSYYINWIREEFREKKTLTSAEAIEYNYNKGLEVLKHKRII